MLGARTMRSVHHEYEVRMCVRACVSACVGGFLIDRSFNIIRILLSEYRIVFLPEMHIPIPDRASPLLLGQDQLGEIGVQLVLLVDALLLDAVPALLLGHAQSAGDVVAKVQPLLLGQVVRCGEEHTSHGR